MLSSNPAYVILAVVFTTGAIMFAAGSVLVRRTREAEPQTMAMLEPAKVTLQEPPWTAELAGNEDPVAFEVRLDMIERLAMVGEPWCVALLERARALDADISVREAADAALMVIGARS